MFKLSAVYWGDAAIHIYLIKLFNTKISQNNFRKRSKEGTKCDIALLEHEESTGQNKINSKQISI